MMKYGLKEGIRPLQVILAYLSGHLYSLLCSSSCSHVRLRCYVTVLRLYVKNDRLKVSAGSLRLTCEVA